MALEDIVNVGKDYLLVANSVEQLKKEPQNPEALDGLLSYMVNKDFDPKHVAGIKIAHSENPYNVKRLAESYSQKEGKRLEKVVKENAREVIYSLPEEEVKNLAFEVKGIGKEYVEIVNAFQEGNLNKIREVCANAYEDPIWKEFVSGTGKEFLAYFGQVYMQSEQEKFMKENEIGKEETDEDGNTSIKLDLDKARSSVYDSLEQLDEKERNSIYLQLGAKYASDNLKSSSE